LAGEEIELNDLASAKAQDACRELTADAIQVERIEWAIAPIRTRSVKMQCH
jgi:hypothetical protein